VAFLVGAFFATFFTAFFTVDFFLAISASNLRWMVE
jgi:hypothetical protein